MGHYKYNPFTGQLDDTGGGAGTPGGALNSIQWNDNGAFNGFGQYTSGSLVAFTEKLLIGTLTEDVSIARAFEIEKTITQSTVSDGAFWGFTINSPITTNAQYIGFEFDFTPDGSAAGVDYSNQLTGIFANAFTSEVRTIRFLQTARFTTDNDGSDIDLMRGATFDTSIFSGTANLMVGNYNNSYAGGGTVGTVYSGWDQLDLDGATVSTAYNRFLGYSFTGGSAAALYNLYLDAQSGLGVPTLVYNAYIASPGKGTTRWALGVDGLDNNHIKGATSFGKTTAPTAQVDIAQFVATSGSPTAFKVTSAAHTTMAAGTEDVGVNLDLSATKQWSTGALSLQREVLIQAPTYSAVGASTLTDSSTVTITGAPISGTNVTQQISSALRIGQFGGYGTMGHLGIFVNQPGIANGVGDVGLVASIGVVAFSTVSLGNQTATANAYGIYTGTLKYDSTTNVRTVTLAAAINVSGAPEANSANVAFGGTYGIIASGRNDNLYNTASLLTRAIHVPDYDVSFKTSTQITASGMAAIGIGQVTFTATAGATILDKFASLYIKGPGIAGTDVTITDNYALWSDAGINRFDGNGTHVFELPADATGNVTLATGRIPVKIGGSTKYLRYYDD